MILLLQFLFQSAQNLLKAQKDSDEECRKPRLQSPCGSDMREEAPDPFLSGLNLLFPAVS